MEIADEDIQAIERDFACVFQDPEEQAVLRCQDSKDIQAGPGSGKTTLLVAKAAILSRKWQWADRGICILSHTNVARQEIEKRLHKHGSGYKLLGYPHFVGTIQSFVDQFFAIPYLQSSGVNEIRVNDELFGLRASKLFPYYKRAYAYAQRKTSVLDAATTLQFEGPKLELACGHGKIGVGSDTPTFADLLALKRRLCEEGVFRFDDMFAFAQAQIAKAPWVVAAIRHRFPWVFVDEMQDTDSKQEVLLQEAFGDGVVLQRLGDINQSIYRESGPAEIQKTFPKLGHLTLSSSKRFGDAIAGFASPLTVKQQTLRGAPGRRAFKNTIFLFGNDTVSSVLGAFGSLLCSEYPAFPEKFIAKAVGARKSDPTDEGKRKIPYNIYDYWPDFQPAPSSPSPASLIQFVRSARHLKEVRGETHEAYNLLISGVLQMLQIGEAKHDSGRRFSKPLLLKALTEKDQRADFDRLLMWLLFSRDGSLPKRWDQATGALVRLMIPWVKYHGQELQEFNAWEEGRAGASRPAADNKRANCYVHKHDDRQVEIEVSTIHSIKGETHHATLVLETCWYTHDLEQMVPFLAGEGDRTKLKKTSEDHMRRVFVASTRPRELLCFAIHVDHVSEDQKNVLVQKGWTLSPVTQPVPKPPLAKLEDGIPKS